MPNDTLENNLKDHFLIAMPSLQGSEFGNSITYICEHNAHGAMGIVINHPMELQLDHIFEHLEIADIDHPHPEAIFAGGPVQTDRGFVLHKKTAQEWQSTLAISDEISLTTSKDILAAIAQNQGPKQSIIALGYAGWSAGQLEQELVDNAWLTLPADSDIIFNTPVDQRAQAAAAKLGIDLSLISPDAGHA